MQEMTDNRYKRVEQTMKRLGYDKSALIEALHSAQETFGYLEKEVLLFIARRLSLPIGKVYGVATFYHHFIMKPQGKHSVIVCLGTACYIKGANEILQKLEKKLGITVGQTTANKMVSLLSARCVGSCSLAPVVICDNKLSGKVCTDASLAKIEEVLQ
jgi:bidirectional [NiFe] hydrogenase diaphorase subunit